jgi:hypothetical protein
MLVSQVVAALDTAAAAAVAAASTAAGRRMLETSRRELAQSAVVSMYPVGTGTMLVAQVTSAQEAQMSRAEAHSAVAQSLCTSIEALQAGKLGEAVDGGLSVDCGAFKSPPPPGSVVGGGSQSLSGSGDEYVDCTWQWIIAFLCGLLLGLILLWYHRRKLLEEIAHPDDRHGRPAGFGGAGGGSGKGCTVMPTSTYTPKATFPNHAPDRALVRGGSAVHGAAPSHPLSAPRPMPRPAPGAHPRPNYTPPARMPPPGFQKHPTPIERARAENARARNQKNARHAPQCNPMPTKPAAPPPVERRFDTDGSAYTREEFFEFYGRDDEWNQASTHPVSAQDADQALVRGASAEYGAAPAAYAYGEYKEPYGEVEQAPAPNADPDRTSYTL